MQFERLSGRKINETVLRRGKVWRGKTVYIHYLRGAPRRVGVDPKKSVLYIGTFASTKLHMSAVTRNRMRRRVREAFRTVAKEWRDIAPMQLLLSPRLASLKVPFPEIQRDIRVFLSTMS